MLSSGVQWTPKMNTISMVAQSYFLPKLLHGKDQKSMLAMLTDIGVSFDEFQESFRRGTFVQRVQAERSLPLEELKDIPVKYRPTGPVLRSDVCAINMPQFNQVTNRIEVIFDGATPLTNDKPEIQ